MARSERKKKTIHYKNFRTKDESQTLQHYLDEALKKRKKPKSRQESLDQDGAILRLINSVRRQDSMLFGQMLRYEAGRDQPVLTIDEDSDEFPIEALPLPASKDGKLREILESVLYFGVLENHVLLLQSPALKSRQFENHLTWLLLHQSGVMPRDMAIVLSDSPTEAAKQKIRATPPRKVVVGTPIESQQREDGPVSSKRVSKVTYVPTGQGAKILAAVMGPDWLENMKLNDSLDDANLRVQIEVSYLRKTTANGERLLEDIANSCRHFEEDDVAVHLKGGGTIKGDELKLQGEITVDTNNGIIDSQDLYARMAQWLTERINQGKV